MSENEISKSSIQDLPSNMTRREVATYLRRHVRSVDRLIAQGVVKAVKVGGSVLVPKSEIARLVNA